MFRRAHLTEQRHAARGPGPGGVDVGTYARPRRAPRLGGHAATAPRSAARLRCAGEGFVRTWVLSNSHLLVSWKGTEARCVQGCLMHCTTSRPCHPSRRHPRLRPRLRRPSHPPPVLLSAYRRRTRRKGSAAAQSPGPVDTPKHDAGSAPRQPKPRMRDHQGCTPSFLQGWVGR